MNWLVGHLTTRWNGPGMLQQQETIDVSGLSGAYEVAIPGRSLVLAAQAQAARSR